VVSRFNTAGIFSTLKLFPRPRESSEVIRILRSVRDLTQTLPDCLGCWLDEGGYLQRPLLYVEQWESEGALHKHLRSDLYSRLLVAMELSAKPPELCFHYVSETKGIGLVQEIRQGPNNRTNYVYALDNS
jgi:quinol monooxygenase YgiN